MTDNNHQSTSASPANGEKTKPRRPVEREVNGKLYERHPVRTHVITREDDIAEVVSKYAGPLLQPGDVVTVSEKVVGITQGRAIKESELKIGFLARILWRFVHKSKYGVGLRRPSSMQCAINECGAWRILLACVVGALGKLIGRRGDFYRVAGMQAATIDAAGTSPLQPDCVCLGPKDPEGVARRIQARAGFRAAVMDINDIGGSWVLGASGGLDRKLLEGIMNDNPCGQKAEQTPICIVRGFPAEKNVDPAFRSV
ncbi:MAG: coenzyme F420-0:L-glutamate ligase [Candidatus Sumerlaeota bacterium]|nr:coenzyme F420-0:L-glutamate ligase [Candidatus Sumerlaeota bacterium]